ncbi:MAG: GAF domain-containing protein [Chloroflexi bacterium]|nr:GAF domain-containing protein [Chloroflexota bacterium]
MDRSNSEEDPRLAGQLRRLLLSMEASGRAILPNSNQDLLQSIVEAAARIFSAAAASIALVNEKQQTLEFKVAYGEGNEAVVGMQIPLDKGIAGYVAMTGQPIAASNVQRDGRFDQEFAQTTGYVPRSILAAPLLSGDRVIAVMEVLDKIDAPSFGMQDMELLALFARQAALAIKQSQQIGQIGATLVQGLQQLAESGSAEEAAQLLPLLEKAEGEGEDREDIYRLAASFNRIASLGDAERKACLQILSAFADYAQSRKGF